MSLSSSDATHSHLLDAVSAAVSGSAPGGQGNGVCPVCGKKRFRYRLNDDGRLVFSCHSGKCGDQSKGDDKDPEWLREVADALNGAGVPENALHWQGNQSGAQTAQSAEPAEPAPDLPSEQRLDAAEDALWQRSGARLRFLEWSGLGEEALAFSEIGWDERERRYWLPVRDEDGTLMTIIRRSLTGRGPKSMVWKGTSGSYVYAPLGYSAEEPVVVAAGEHDYFRLVALGYNVVSFTNGESTCPAPERLGELSNCDLVFLYDNDEGNKSKTIASRLLSHVKSIRIGLWQRDVPHGYDVTDVLDDNTLGQAYIDKALAEAIPWGKEEARAEGAAARAETLFRERIARYEADRLWQSYEARNDDDVLANVRGLFNSGSAVAQELLEHMLTLEEVLAMSPQRHVIGEWVACGHYTVLYGPPGSLKTFLLNDMALRIAHGVNWHDHDTEKGLVLFFQGEGLTQMRVRIEAWRSFHEGEVRGKPAAVLMSEKTFDLATPEGVAAVVRTVNALERQHGKKASAVVIDPLLRFARSDSEGVESTAMASVGLDALARMIPYGAVIVGQHSNATGARSRGTEHLKMFAGSHIRVDREGPVVVLTQEKYRFGEEMVLVLRSESEEKGLIFTAVDEVPKGEYAAKKEEDRREARASADDAKALGLMRWLIVERKNAPQARNAMRECGVKGLGSDRALKPMVERLFESGELVEVEGKFRVSDEAVKRLTGDV